MKLQLFVLAALATIVMGCGSKKGYQNKHYVMEETYVHKYGMEVEADEWLTRGQSGQVISQLDNGVKIAKNYADGILNGETTYTFPHSEQIEKMEVYDKGSLVKVIFHDQNGNPEMETRYLDNGKSKAIYWYDGGAPRCCETYQDECLMSGIYYSPDGKIENRFEDGSGLRIVRNELGELVSHENVMGGNVVRRSTFYQNGAPKEIIPISQGKVEGIKKSYLSHGEPNTIEEWRNGCQHGKTVVFRGGEKFAEVPYLYGKKYGVERRFKDGVQVVEELTWENDLLHGPCHTYLSGNIKTEWYFYGSRVSKASFDIARQTN